MKKIRFLSVGLIAAALMLSLTAGQCRAQKDYLEDADQVADQKGDAYIYYQQLSMNYDELYTNYYSPRVSTYYDNLSAWDKWSAYATTEEADAINAILDAEEDLLSDMAGLFSDLNYHATLASNAYGDYWISDTKAWAIPDHYGTDAQDAWAHISDWYHELSLFHDDTGAITNDVIDFDEDYQPYFESILQGIINRNS